MEIMQAAWGPFTQWSKEEQAWYSQLMVDMGLQGKDHTLYVEPKGSVDEETAIAIARGEIAKGFDLEESALDAYIVTTSFQVPEFAEPGDDQPYWYVEFMAPDSMPEDQRAFYMFWVFIHPDSGELLESVEEQVARSRAYQDKLASMENDPLMQEMRSFEETYDSNPSRMSLEAKAQWSQSFRQRVLEKHAQDPEYFGRIDIAMAAFIYGLPDEKAITQEEAFELAKSKLLELLVEQLGRKEEEVYFFAHRFDVYYDITDPERPLWKFFFHMPNEWVSDEAYAQRVREYYGENGERLPNIKVEINAYTGEVFRAFTIDFSDINSAEAYKEAL